MDVKVCREVASHAKPDDTTLGKSVSRKSSFNESLSRTGCIVQCTILTTSGANIFIVI